MLMITGHIEKATGSLWRAECALIGAFTQGKSRKDAAAMLADCIEVLVGRDGWKVTTTEIGPSGKGFAVAIDASDVGVLLAEVLKHQRRVHKLTITEVAKRLGSANPNTYAAYERGEREPSLSKYVAMLAAVAPELELTVGPRTTKAAR